MCVRVRVWEGDGGQMIFQGSYLNRRLKSITLLLVALLLLVLPQSVLCRQWSHTPENHSAGHVFFGVGPFILHWFPPVDLPGLSSDIADEPCARSWFDVPHFLHFLHFFFFFRECAICDFPSETSATAQPPFWNALRLEKNCELMRCSLIPYCYYRKRGSASYILREVHSVRERDR